MKFFSGYKTIIGLVLIGAGAVVQVYDPTMGMMLTEAGKMLAQVGLVHKAIKAGQ